MYIYNVKYNECLKICFQRIYLFQSDITLTLQSTCTVLEFDCNLSARAFSMRIKFKYLKNNHNVFVSLLHAPVSTFPLFFHFPLTLSPSVPFVPLVFPTQIRAEEWIMWDCPRHFHCFSSESAKILHLTEQNITMFWKHFFM